MSRLRVNAFGISIDGFGAGPRQSLENPMGVSGMALHEWVLGTQTFQALHGDFAASLTHAINPVILGQGENLFHGLDLASLGYKCTEQAASPKAMHVVLTR